MTRDRRTALVPLPIDAMHRCRIAKVRERSEHQSVDDVEHRRVGADAESERDDDRGGERGRPAKAAERIPNVLLESVERGNRPDRAVSRSIPVDVSGGQV